MSLDGCPLHFAVLPVQKLQNMVNRSQSFQNLSAVCGFGPIQFSDSNNAPSIYQENIRVCFVTYTAALRFIEGIFSTHAGNLGYSMQEFLLIHILL